jgi:hypothetical protein
MMLLFARSTLYSVGVLIPSFLALRRDLTSCRSLVTVSCWSNSAKRYDLENRCFRMAGMFSSRTSQTLCMAIFISRAYQKNRRHGPVLTYRLCPLADQVRHATLWLLLLLFFHASLSYNPAILQFLYCSDSREPSYQRELENGQA